MPEMPGASGSYRPGPPPLCPGLRPAVALPHLPAPPPVAVSSSLSPLLLQGPAAPPVPAICPPPPPLPPTGPAFCRYHSPPAPYLSRHSGPLSCRPSPPPEDVTNQTEAKSPLPRPTLPLLQASATRGDIFMCFIGVE